MKLSFEVPNVVDGAIIYLHWRKRKTQHQGGISAGSWSSGSSDFPGTLLSIFYIVDTFRSITSASHERIILPLEWRHCSKIDNCSYAHRYRLWGILYACSTRHIDTNSSNVFADTVGSACAVTIRKHPVSFDPVTFVNVIKLCRVIICLSFIHLAYLLFSVGIFRQYTTKIVYKA